MSSITLNSARQIADFAFEEGKQRGITALTVVVIGTGGNIRVAMQADGASLFGVEIAQAKATTALAFNTSSLSLAERFSNAVVAQGLTAVTKGRFLAVGGGIALLDETGATIGAAAVSGGPQNIDHEIITTAATRAGLRAC